MMSEKTQQLIAREIEREYLHAQKVAPLPKYIFQDLNALQRFWRVFCRKVLRFDPYPPIRIEDPHPLIRIGGDGPKESRVTFKQ